MYAPTGHEVEQRLKLKLCIRCGVRPAIDWPYVCPDCQRKVSEDKHTKDKPHER
jgi:hypothetical protein